MKWDSLFAWLQVIATSTIASVLALFAIAGLSVLVAIGLAVPWNGLVAGLGGVSVFALVWISFRLRRMRHALAVAEQSVITTALERRELEAHLADAQGTIERGEEKIGFLLEQTLEFSELIERLDSSGQLPNVKRFLYEARETRSRALRRLASASSEWLERRAILRDAAEYSLHAAVELLGGPDDVLRGSLILPRPDDPDFLEPFLVVGRSDRSESSGHEFYVGRSDVRNGQRGVAGLLYLGIIESPLIARDVSLIDGWIPPASGRVDHEALIAQRVTTTDSLDTVTEGVTGNGLRGGVVSFDVRSGTLAEESRWPLIYVIASQFGALTNVIFRERDAADRGANP